ncbi:hypothetical protein KAU33_06980, partial [Candidatus Dependentiae bacterium]|nr:hypothetical protein [Candidatus Dependentiae bacterium]
MKGLFYPNNEVILKFIKKHKLISTDILNKLYLKTDKNQVNFGQEIFEKGLLSEDDFAWFSSQLFQLPNLELSNLPIAEELFINLPAELLARYLFFPITTIGDELIIGVVNPFLDGLYEIIDLIFSKQYQLNIVKRSEFDKLLHKLDHVIISESIPSIEFSDDLLDDPDFKDDETCIALSYYLILSLFKSKNRYIQLYPNNHEGEVKILEGMNLVKNIQLEKFQYHILLWRLKKLFNIRQFNDQGLNSKTVKDFFYEKQNYR